MDSGQFKIQNDQTLELTRLELRKTLMDEVQISPMKDIIYFLSVHSSVDQGSLHWLHAP